MHDRAVRESGRELLILFLMCIKLTFCQMIPPIGLKKDVQTWLPSISIRYYTRSGKVIIIGLRSVDVLDIV